MENRISAFFPQEDEASVPPRRSLNAEMQLLGTLLLLRDIPDHLTDIIQADTFESRQNALIFDAIGEMRNLGLIADAVTLVDWLSKTNKLDDAGNVDYLLQVIDSVRYASK